MKLFNHRRLTLAEIDMAYSIFANSIDYCRVKIYAGIPFLPIKNTAIAPGNCIFFPCRHCLNDFSQDNIHYQMWLIHELTHVWQRQHGYHLWLGGLILSIKGGYYN